MKYFLHQTTEDSKEMIHSDEGLTLETSVFESFTVVNVAIEHARHVCGLMLARFLWTSTKN